MLVDTHTHLAPYSHDARQKIGELLADAARQNLEAVCVTDHYEKDIFYDSREDIFDLAEFFQDLRAVKAARRHIQPSLLLGVELGYLPHLGGHFAELTAKWPFDSVILSLHILDGQDPYVSPTLFEAGQAEVYSRYLRQLATMVESCPDCDIIGHFDYITRYAPYADRKIRYADFSADFDDLFQVMIRQGAALEINTRTIVKLRDVGYRGLEAWPDPEVIRRYLALGGEKVSLGSDAHKAGEAGLLFHETIKWLRELGCGKVVHFERRRPIYTPI